MRILKMTATFGCLEQAVLEPQEGLNLWILPNESGKSTWSAFLVAMFYGIDTTRRSSKGKLAEKARYQPWSGQPMSGILELETEGRVLVLQRTSERGRPMGAFRAYDRDTGRDVRELTATNCGEVLLGVERSVFERTAFLRGSELGVTQDQELARRLGALAVSGSESDSYPEAENRLKLWQNRCRYHRTGRIPEAEDALAVVQEKLQAMEAVRRRRLACMQELEETREKISQLQAEQDRSDADQRRLLRDTLDQAHQRYERKAAAAAVLPEEEELRTLQQKLLQAQPVEDGPEPPCAPALRDVTAETIWPQVQKDLHHYEILTAMTLRGSGGLLLAALLTLLGAGGLLALRFWWLSVMLVILSGVFWWLWGQNLHHNRQVNRNLDEASALLERYDARSKDQLLHNAVLRRDWLLAHEKEQREAWTLELAMEQVRSFAPQTETILQAREAVEAGIRTRRELAACSRELEKAQLQWQLAAQKRENPELEQFQREEIRLQTEARGDLRQEQALGDWEELCARQETQLQQLQQLQLREEAIALARQALGAAQEQMEQVYAPHLTRLAGDYLKKLTGGHYDALILKQELELSVREEATGLIRPLTTLSRGTQDQTWLALRLAMTALLLPEKTPIVLDDALLTFDPEREEAARQVLGTLGRQVLLFSCR